MVYSGIAGIEVGEGLQWNSAAYRKTGAVLMVQGKGSGTPSVDLLWAVTGSGGRLLPCPPAPSQLLPCVLSGKVVCCISHVLCSLPFVALPPDANAPVGAQVCRSRWRGGCLGRRDRMPRRMRLSWEACYVPHYLWEFVTNSASIVVLPPKSPIPPLKTR